MIHAAPQTTVKYAYSFTVWPDESWGFPRSMFHLFEMLKGRVEMEFTPEQFETFRSDLSHHGLTMREIERIPFHEPEPVF